MLDIDLTEEELNAMAADSEKNNDEELDEVAGGGSYIDLKELNDRFKCKHPKRVKQEMKRNVASLFSGVATNLNTLARIAAKHSGLDIRPTCGRYLSRFVEQMMER